MTRRVASDYNPPVAALHLEASRAAVRRAGQLLPHPRSNEERDELTFQLDTAAIHLDAATRRGWKQPLVTANEVRAAAGLPKLKSARRK